MTGSIRIASKKATPFFTAPLGPGGSWPANNPQPDWLPVRAETNAAGFLLPSDCQGHVSAGHAHFQLHESWLANVFDRYGATRPGLPCVYFQIGYCYDFQVVTDTDSALQWTLKMGAQSIANLAQTYGPVSVDAVCAWRASGTVQDMTVTTRAHLFGGRRNGTNRFNIKIKAPSSYPEKVPCRWSWGIRATRL